MGICDSTNDKNKIESFISEESYNKEGNKNTQNNVLKYKNIYILPENLSKRDDISKYYNITQKILGEGASGVVCIGEKNGKQYAIKKIKKDKIKKITIIFSFKTFYT